VHGGKQIKGLEYWETYAPVASWPSIRLIMYIAVLHKWPTMQLDFVLAFPQAPAETDIFIQIPQGFSLQGGNTDHCLKLINNLYGQKQAGRVWNKHLTKGLTDINFVQSKTDPCVFWRDMVILVIYTDDTIVAGPCNNDVQKAVNDIGNKFNITSKPTVDDFLGVKITHNHDDGITTMTQPQLIDSILEDLHLDNKSNGKRLPAQPTKLLQTFENSEDHDNSFHFRSVIGKLNYLEKSTRPDIAYAVHQCARFSANPKTKHTKAVKLIRRYLKYTRDKGIICTPSKHRWNAMQMQDLRVIGTLVLLNTIIQQQDHARVTS
jgi:Reverse transcriptase (RNA-dependent DNA polymerase)